MKDMFYDIPEIVGTKLPLFGSCVYPDTKVGEYFLQSSVISMWDFGNYNDCFTYVNTVSGENVRYVVRLCVRTDEKTTRSVNLNKDLSNIQQLTAPSGVSK